MMPAPLPFTLEEPSILKLHTLLESMSYLSFLCLSNVLSVLITTLSALVEYVNFAMNSSMACPLMAVLGMNLMLNSPSSIAYLVSTNITYA